MKATKWSQAKVVADEGEGISKGWWLLGIPGILARGQLLVLEQVMGKENNERRALTWQGFYSALEDV